MSSTICFNLDQSKILSSGNGLKFNLVLFTEDNSFTFSMGEIDKIISQKVMNVERKVRWALRIKVSVSPLPDDKILDWSKLKQMTFWSAFKMKNKCHVGKKTLWEKKKLLVTSNFSFSHNVFYSFISLCVKMRHCVVMGLLSTTSFPFLMTLLETGFRKDCGNQYFLLFFIVSLSLKNKFQFLSRINFVVCKCF